MCVCARVTFTAHVEASRVSDGRFVEESVALDAMGGDANALKVGQTLADKFRQAGYKKETAHGMGVGWFFRVFSFCRR